jgi:hypothetical protein
MQNFHTLQLWQNNVNAFKYEKETVPLKNRRVTHDYYGSVGSPCLEITVFDSNVFLRLPQYLN